MNKQFLFIGGFGLLLLLAGFFIFKKAATTPSVNKPQTGNTPETGNTLSPTPETVLQLPEMEIDQNKKYIATLKTSKGEIVIELNTQITPITVNNFVSLSRKKFYDNTTFHRIIKDFMIQGGDPQGDGTGSPGYRFDDEPFEGEYTRGTVAMANAGPNTNGSQFFIMHQDYSLPKNYVIFGRVIEGIETVDKIAESPVGMSASEEESKPVEQITLDSIEIAEE